MKKIRKLDELQSQKIVNNWKISVFNSSSNLSYRYQNRVKSTVIFFKKNNIDIELGDLTFKKGTYRSGTIKERSDEFNFLLNKSNIMLSMIGGFNSSSILKNINYNMIKSNKIKVIGCSDTTALLLAIYKKTNNIVYYGPSFLMSYYEQKYIQDFNFKQLINNVFMDRINEIDLPQKVTLERYDWSFSKIKEKKLIKNKIKFINKPFNEIVGRLIGGNLNTMASLIGTEFMPKIREGDILFIEDSFVNASITERNMSVLKNSGILDKVAVIIIGLIENFDAQKSRKKYHEILLEFLDHDIPIIYDFPCSHIQPSVILKIGATLKIDFREETFQYLCD